MPVYFRLVGPLFPRVFSITVCVRARKRDCGKILRDWRFYEPRQKGINCDYSVISGSPSIVIYRLLFALSHSLTYTLSLSFFLSFSLFHRYRAIVVWKRMTVYSSDRLRRVICDSRRRESYARACEEPVCLRVLSTAWTKSNFVWRRTDFATNGSSTISGASNEPVARPASSAEWKRKITCPEGPDTIKCSTVRTRVPPNFWIRRNKRFPFRDFWTKISPSKDTVNFT